MIKKFPRRYPKKKRLKVVESNVLMQGPKEHCDLKPDEKKEHGFSRGRGFSG